MSSEAIRPLQFYLNHNKLCRPLPRSYVRRPRLLAQLDGLSTAKLGLLCAEAGYGKTILIVDFLRTWPHPAVWYRLDKEDRDVNRFVAYLTEGIAQHHPEFRFHTARRLAGGGNGAASPSRRLLHELGRLPAQPLLIVLDNFEAVARSQEVCELVSDLLEGSGPDLHLIIASRTAIPIPVARLEARGEVVALGPHDLALSQEETRELLDLHARQVTDGQLKVLWRRTEGWPAGMDMVAEALRQRRAHEVVDSLEDIHGPPDLVYRYFAEEVFEEQSPALQEFLVKTAILKRLAHDVVNALLEIDNGGEMLNLLRSGGTFAHTVEAGGGDLRYHPLFRTFLLRKLHACYGDDYIRDLHRRAARAAAQHHYWSDAIDSYSTAGDWAEVGGLVERVGDDLTRRGFLETVRQWLDLMPENLIVARPTLLLLRGRVLREAGRHQEALRDLERAARGFAEVSDSVGEVRAEIESGLARYWLGEFQRAETLMAGALARAGGDAALRSEIMAHLAGICTGSDDLEKVAHWGQMAARESVSAGHAPTTCLSLARALRYLGRALILQGEIQRGLEDVARSVELCRGEDVGDLETAWSLFTTGQGLALRGDLDEARRVLDEAEALVHGSHHLMNRIWTWRGTVHRDAGAFDRADQDYGRAGERALRELAFLRLRQDRVAEGLHLAQEAHRAAVAGESLGERAGCQAVLGIALGAAGERRAALQQLAGAAETLRHRGRRQQAASVAWHSARLLLEEGKRAAALEQLGEALAWAAGRGVYHLWWWDPETVGHLWSLAFGAELSPGYLLELARLRLGPGQAGHLSQALDSAPPGLRAQLVETVHAISGGSFERDLGTDLLRSCHDPAARRHIGDALAAGVLTPRDLARLRGETALTWKEVEILTLYYLDPNVDAEDRRFRRRLAESLALSEHTLKVHIRNIRRKLDLHERQRGVSLALVTPLGRDRPA